MREIIDYIEAIRLGALVPVIEPDSYSFICYVNVREGILDQNVRTYQ